MRRVTGLLAAAAVAAAVSLLLRQARVRRLLPRYAWTTEVVRTFLLKGERFRPLDRYGGLPTDSVILQRITVGLLAVLGRLHATGNWHRITRELWLGDAPATSMGEAEAAWRASRERDRCVAVAS